MKKTVDDLDTAKYFEEFEKICEIYNTEEYKDAIHQEAIEDAKEKGIIEEKINIAKAMLKENFDTKLISEIINITEIELEKLKKTL